MPRRSSAISGAGVDFTAPGGDEPRRFGGGEIMSAGTPSPTNLGEAIPRLRAKWGAILAFGLLLTLLGLASLVFAFFSTLAMVTLNGVLLLVAGAAEIGVGMHARS